LALFPHTDSRKTLHRAQFADNAMRFARVNERAPVGATQTGTIQAPERLFWLAVLVGHAIAALLWWWLEPRGFPWNHPRFWSNQVLPLLALSWICGSLVHLHRENRRALFTWLAAFPTFWLASSIAARVVFPITFAWIWIAPL
jgi:hypothetical protein